MKRIVQIMFLLLAVYTLVLLVIDIREGQEQARGYFSDIVTGTDYPLPIRALFGINTTLNVVMLVGCALLFSLCLGADDSRKLRGRPLFFPASQFVFFLYLAADERLLFHEKAAAVLNVPDTLLLIVLGVVELVLLLGPGRVVRIEWSVKGWLLPAAAGFACMAFIDAFLPDEMRGRLALEDLSKTWATAFLLVFSWNYVRMCCSSDGAAREPATTAGNTDL